MKCFPIFLIVMACGLSACRKDSAPPVPDSPPPAAEAVPSPAVMDRAPAREPNKMAAVVTLEPDVAGSLLRVRVNIGGVVSKDFPAVLLHHTAVLKAGQETTLRCVLAHVPGYDETKLRQKACTLTVLRRKFDDQSNASTVSSLAWLVRLDPATGLALLGYAGGFDYGDDLGLSPESKADVAAVTVTRTFYNVPEGGDTPMDRSLWILDNEGATSTLNPASHKVVMPGWPVREGGQAGAVVLNGKSVLGFVAAGTGREGRLVSAAGFDTSLSLPTLSVVGMKFRNQSPYLKVQYDLGSIPADGVFLQSTSESAETLYELGATSDQHGRFKDLKEEAKHSKNSLFAQGFSTSQLEGKKAGQVELPTGFPAPATHGEEKSYMLQPYIAGPFQRFMCRPVLLKLRSEPSGLIPVVKGVDALDMPAADVPPALPEKTLTLEAPVLQACAMRGGKEVLFQLKGPPFWKRYSFETNDWLPLPPSASSQVRFTGSRDALYMLEPSSQVVQKFSAEDLRLLARTQLPAGRDFFAIVAGCLASRAPIYVFHAHGVMTLAPDDLQPQGPAGDDSSNNAPSFSFAQDTVFVASGDGMSFATPGQTAHPLSSYFGDARGIRNAHPFNPQGYGIGMQPGVSGAFNLREDSGELFDFTQAPGSDRPPQTKFDGEQSRRRLLGLQTSSPVVFRVVPGDSTEVPPTPARLQFFSIFDPRSFLELPVKEFNLGLSQAQFGYDATIKRLCRVFLEPASLKVATLAPDDLTWTVREAVSAVKPDVPVLLNWPDVVMRPGQTHDFLPRISGAALAAAQVLGRPQAVSLTSPGHPLSIRMAETEFATLLVLQLRLQPAQGEALTCRIPLQLPGYPRPVLVPPDFDETKLAQLHQDRGPPDMETSNIQAVSSQLLRSSSPIIDIPGVAGEFAVLRLVSDKIQFLSLKPAKIVHTMSIPPGSHCFVGAGALYVFDAPSRTISRISVPGGVVEKTFSMPKGIDVKAVGIGHDLDSPLSLLAEATTSQESVQMGNLRYSFREFRRQLVVLDNQFNERKPWSPPVFQETLLKGGAQSSPRALNAAVFSNEVARMPTSYNGRVLTLPQGCAVLGRRFSTIFSLDFEPGKSLSSLSERPSLGGSQSGLVVSGVRGECYKMGTKVASPSDAEAYVDPSGRYQWCEAGGLPRVVQDLAFPSPVLDLRIVENGKKVARLARLPILDGFFQTMEGKPVKKAFPLNETGLLALLSPSGMEVQLLNLDYAQIAKTFAPRDLHVVSQPVFYVAERQPYDYQIEVNNPEAVQEYRLQTEVLGASLSQGGLLHYVQPPGTRAPARIQFVVEIKDKNGVIYIHDFPLQILAPPLPAQEAPKVLEKTSI